jgi:hypothetical protein
MDGVESVTQLGGNRLKWVARIAGVRREWEATVLERVPERRLAWASTGGATNAGAVEFSDVGGNRTEVSLTLEYLPEGMLERVGELLHAVGRQAEHDLKKFKKFIEHEGHAAGEWRNTVPGAAQDTAESLTGDSPREYNRFAHPFDQTGGLVDLEGESDGSAEGEAHSRADRRGARRPDGTFPPLGGTLGDR